MHELSVALEVCRMAEEQVGAARAREVVTVAVEVGDDAGLEPSALTFCLETLLAQPPFAGARPVLLPQRGDALRLAWLEVDDGRPDH